MAPLRPICCVLALLAASCGESGDPTAGKSPEQLRREIEAVATPPLLPKDRPPPFRLRPLKVGEVREYIGSRPACMLVYRDRIFFTTIGVEGIARVDGRLARLAASGPVAGSGGFFRAEGATISIGRVAQYAGRAAAYVPGWAVDVAVGGAADIKPQRFEGSWTCRERFAPEQVRPVAALRGPSPAPN
jgi:hypothetical protein